MDSHLCITLKLRRSGSLAGRTPGNRSHAIARAARISRLPSWISLSAHQSREKQCFFGRRFKRANDPGEAPRSSHGGQSERAIRPLIGKDAKAYQWASRHVPMVAHRTRSERIGVVFENWFARSALRRSISNADRQPTIACNFQLWFAANLRQT
jgi:hypothetical protein